MADELTQGQIADGETGGAATRRALLRTAGAGAAVATVAVTAAACGSSSNGTVGNPASANAAGGGASDSAGSGSGSGTVLAKTSQIPVDGGMVISSAQIVVTQPSAGVFKAFTAVCTHQGCTVSNVSDNQIQCPCHGSVFSAKDGSVIQGPASAPLAAKTITVANGQITAA
ncbi:MAG TPA: Rieske (2Fe-2S) protein [Actinocrinis sp.]|nr:Rieske (2Fe-2S) protein [Actinocrinis sp.]